MHRIVFVPLQLIDVNVALPAGTAVGVPTMTKPGGSASVTRTCVVGDAPLLRMTMLKPIVSPILAGDGVVRVFETTSRSVTGRTVVVCVATLFASWLSAAGVVVVGCSVAVTCALSVKVSPSYS